MWLNGHRLGYHIGANLPFEFDLNVRKGINRLVVRVDNRVLFVTFCNFLFGNFVWLSGLFFLVNAHERFF